MSRLFASGRYLLYWSGTTLLWIITFFIYNGFVPLNSPPLPEPLGILIMFGIPVIAFLLTFWHSAILYLIGLGAVSLYVFYTFNTTSSDPSGLSSLDGIFLAVFVVTPLTLIGLIRVLWSIVNRFQQKETKKTFVS